MAIRKDPEVRDALAAGYVLGTLGGRARARFRSLLRYDPRLRRATAEWEARLAPLAGCVPEVPPPARVWRAIERRVRPVRRDRRWWESLAYWRAFSAAIAVFAIALGIALATAPRPEPPTAMVAVMANAAGRTAMVVSWPPMGAMREPRIRVKVMEAHPTMAPSTSWELWLLPEGDAAPVSLGLVSLDREQVMKVPPALGARMRRARAMALSVEPVGGSPTGAPTGPVIFKGDCVRIL
ncbi:MAG: anti-sigma factor [Burkholderiales bacterium]|nr:anti-sigma factor [Burkholderiales bacterium]